MTRTKLAILITAASILAITSLSSATRAHGGASWIMENPKIAPCCGPKDCGWVAAEHVRFDGRNYVIAEGTPVNMEFSEGSDIWRTEMTHYVPYGTVLFSINHHYWICFAEQEDSRFGGRVIRITRCFFIPVAGT